MIDRPLYPTRTMRKCAWLPVVLLVACGTHGDGGGTDGITRPVRLDLPVPIDSIVLGPTGGLSFFGAHEGWTVPDSVYFEVVTIHDVTNTYGQLIPPTP